MSNDIVDPFVPEVNDERNPLGLDAEELAEVLGEALVVEPESLETRAAARAGLTLLTVDMPAEDLAETLETFFRIMADSPNDLEYQASIDYAKMMLAEAKITSVTKKSIATLAARVRKVAKKRREDAANARNPMWTLTLTPGKGAHYLATRANAVDVIRNHDELCTSLGWDELGQCAAITGALPWAAERHGSDALRDSDIGEFAYWFERNGWGLFSAGSVELLSAVTTVAHDRPFNRALEDFKAVAWDGVPRVAGLLLTHFGAEPKPEPRLDESEADFREREAEHVEKIEWVKAATKKWLIQMARRVANPGCKADYMLVLTGAQGSMKSTFASELVPGGSRYFGDCLPPIETKDAKQYLQGRVLVEVAELAGFGKAAIEAVKAFVTTPTDKFRASYGRLTEEHPRTCVFLGTTNHEEFLVDETGNRRFWPVKVGNLDIAALRRDRAQILAEVWAAHLAGDKAYFDSSEASLAAVGVAAQEKATKADPWETKIAAKLSQPSTLFVTTAELLELVGEAGFNNYGDDKLGIPLYRQTQKEANRVYSIVTKLGWMKARRRLDGVQCWGFVRVGT